MRIIFGYVPKNTSSKSGNPNTHTNTKSEPILLVMVNRNRTCVAVNFSDKWQFTKGKIHTHAQTSKESLNRFIYCMHFFFVYFSDPLIHQWYLKYYIKLHPFFPSLKILLFGCFSFIEYVNFYKKPQIENRGAEKKIYLIFLPLSVPIWFIGIKRIHFFSLYRFFVLKDHLCISSHSNATVSSKKWVWKDPAERRTPYKLNNYLLIFEPILWCTDLCKVMANG